MRRLPALPALPALPTTAEFVDRYWLGKINHHPELEAGISWAEYLGEAKALLGRMNKDFGVKWQLDRAARLESR